MKNDRLYKTLEGYIASEEQTTLTILFSLALWISKGGGDRSEQISLSSKDGLKDCFLLAIIFVLREIEGMEWKDIKKVLDLFETKGEFSTISLSRRVRAIKEKLVKELNILLKELTIDNIRDVIKKDPNIKA